MIRIAWYILAGAEPLATLNFLPADYRIFAPLGLISIAAIGIFCWHKGAQLQERVNHNSSGRYYSEKNEFMDLLRYYFRHSNKKDLREILDDCEERFIRGRRLGMSDDEISRELGSPRDIYRYYMGEEIDTAPHRQTCRKRRQIFNYDGPSERHPEFSDNYNPPFYDADDYEQEEPEAHGTHREAPPLNMFERFLYTLLGRLCAFLGSIFYSYSLPAPS